MTADTPTPDENGATAPDEPQGRANGQGETNGQQGADMGVSEDPVPSAAVPVTVIPEVLAASTDNRETVKVHPSAPEADALAIEEHGLTWDIPVDCHSCGMSNGGFWRNARGQRICGGHPRLYRGPCRQTSIYDNGRCRFHNGLAARGVAASQYKRGRWAKALGKRGAAYTDARDDPELLDMRRTIGALDVIVKESMERREGLDTPDFRSRLREMWRAYRVALKADDDRLTPEAPALLDDIGKLIRRGASADDANETIARNVSRMAKHVEAGWKIQLSGAQSVNKAELLAVIESITDVMIQEVPPDHVRSILLAIDRQVLRGQLAWAGIDAASGG